MSNCDVPSLEACQRLAKVWTPAPSPMGVVHVPTIGMMLAEIRRRGWFTKHRVCIGPKEERLEVWEIYSDDSYSCRLGCRAHERHADALARALAEAIEKEAGSDQ